jgi:DNA-binding transcriptional MerR regulator
MNRIGSSPEWRIDELAVRAGLPVGTIRLYQRSGLLPLGRRVGRSMVYGISHLDRLVRIQELKSASFTLTAIKRMLDEGQFVMLDRLFGTDGRPRNAQQLVEESGLDPALVTELESLGFLASPTDRGASLYDGGEASVLQAIAELIAIGTPPSIFSVVLPIYVHHVRALEKDLVSALTGDADLSPELPAEAVASYADRAVQHTEEFLYRWDVIVDYLHHRMIQRLVHRARVSAEPAAPADPDRQGTGRRIRA